MKNKRDVCFQLSQRTCHETNPTNDLDPGNEYFTSPPLDQFYMDAQEECWVETFCVGHRSYGCVRFLGKTNVAGINMKELRSIGMTYITGGFTLIYLCTLYYCASCFLCWSIIDTVY